MAANTYSTVEFRSNVFPVAADDILHDEPFLHSLRDPIALQEFSKRAYRYYPSPLQREILLKGVGIKCAYADEGDLSWGTVRENGIEKVVCLCEKYSCESFSRCRPSVSAPVETIVEHTEEKNPVLPDFEKEFEEPLLPVDEAVEDAHTYDESPSLAQVFEAAVDEFVEQSLMALAPKPARPLHEEKDAGLDRTTTIESTIAESDTNGLGDEVTGREGVLGRYDQHQAAIVCAAPRERIYVNAGPGAGKTHTLIEKVKYLMEEQGIEPDRITVLSFTRAAVSVVQNRLKAAAERGEIHALWQDVDVTTFDKLCTRILYYDAGETGDEAAKKRISGLNYDQRIVSAKNLIAKKPELLSACDHLIVDETQDLVGPRADLVITMLAALPEGCGFTLFGDRCQAIYEYQVKDSGGTTSGEFFEQVCLRFAPEQIYLEKNYRQKQSYPLDLSSLRSALLEDDVYLASSLIGSAAGSLGTPDEPLRSLEPEAIQQELSRGKIGVLTRKNDEALEIESLLWKLGVPALQARSDARKKPSRCLADVFVKCKGETIAREEFEELAAGSDPYGDGRIWRALVSLEGVHLEGDRLRIENALAALNSAVIPPELLATRSNEQGITVSTVHTSKGREFDTVWMLAENLADFRDGAEMEEKRVAYVGLTRGAENLSLQCLDEHFIVGGKNSFKTHKMFKKDRYFRKRSSGRGRTGKSRVVNIEIRNETDVDETSFRNSGKVQEALAAGLLEGEPLRFVLRGTGDRIRYDIVLQDDEGFLLGHLTRTFIDDYIACAGDAPLPDAFDQVYIDRITTCAGRSTVEATYDRAFGDMAVWYGFTIGGYAHRDDSQGY